MAWTCDIWHTSTPLLCLVAAVYLAPAAVSHESPVAVSSVPHESPVAVSSVSHESPVAVSYVARKHKLLVNSAVGKN